MFEAPVVGVASQGEFWLRSFKRHTRKSERGNRRRDGRGGSSARDVGAP